jgi:CTP synthase
MFCQVEPEEVVAVHDVSSTYHVPLLLEKQGVIALLRDILKLDAIKMPPYLLHKGQHTWEEWKTLTTSQERLYETVSIALVGKYTNLHDSYLSVIKALEHSAMACSKKLNLIWVDASHLEQSASTTSPADFHKAWHEVCTANGILVPGGFGRRGTEGMIAAANWARKNKTPFLGICLGMQIAVIEFARNVCSIPNAASIELDERTTDPVIIFMPEIDKVNLGGTMRLGLRPTIFQPDTEWSKLRSLYLPTDDTINERHRHRYEVNPEYIDRLAQSGLHFIGKDNKGERMEIIELKDHPYFVGVQFHPEYLSRVLNPSKPYLGFVAASAGMLDTVVEKAKKAAEGFVNGDKMANGELVNGLKNISI